MAWTNNPNSPIRPCDLQDAINCDSGGGSTTLTQALADFNANVTSAQGLNLTFTCPDCGGAGNYARSHDSGISGDNVLIKCKTCTGYGKTAAQKTPKPGTVWI